MIRRPPRVTRTAHSFPTRRSSDLRGFVCDTVQCAVREDDAVGKGIECEVHEVDPIKSRQGRRRRAGKRRQAGCKGRASPRWRMRCGRRGQTRDTIPRGRAKRSEEHTSELQSLMRISNAVFCLKQNTSKRLISKQPTII